MEHDSIRNLASSKLELAERLVDAITKVLEGHEDLVPLALAIEALTDGRMTLALRDN